MCQCASTLQADGARIAATTKPTLKTRATITAQQAFGYESSIVDPEMVSVYRHRFATLPRGVVPLNDADVVALWSTRFRAYATEALRMLYTHNGMMDVPDLVMIWAMVRAFQPRQVLEIGAGYSSYVFDKAIVACREKGGDCGRHVAIEPYRSKVLAHLQKRVDVVQTPLQDVPLDTFKRLGRNDILFIDSSHVTRPYGDVV